MDGKIVEVMKALRVYLLAKLPALRAVEISPGVFDDDEVKRIVSRSDTLHLAFLGVNRAEQTVGGPLQFHAAFGAYIATSGVDRVFAGLNTLEVVASLLSTAGEGDDEGLGVTYTGTPVIGSIENLYGKEVGKRGLAILGLAFAVPVIIGRELFGGDLSTLNQILQLQGLDGTQDEIVLDFDNDERVEAIDA